MARHPQPVADGGGRAGLEAQCGASQLRPAAPEHAGGPAGQRRCQERGRRLVSGRARHQVLAPSGRAPAQEARALDCLRGAGGDHAPVRPRHCQYRAAMAGRGGWSPAAQAAAGSALGEEGRQGGGAGTRHALRHRGLQQPPRGLRPYRSGQRARDLHSSGAGGRRLGIVAAFSGRQPQDGAAG